ncbi:MAG: hypothetical protein M3094_06215 [Actinomycetia bacterium]|nr:hypothetical protein [Actinomycetes bacterium]
MGSSVVVVGSIVVVDDEVVVSVGSSPVGGAADCVLLHIESTNTPTSTIAHFIGGRPLISRD